MNNAVLIVAAGRGTRFKSPNHSFLPKQYNKIYDSYIIELTIEKFLYSEKIDFIKIVIHPNDIDIYEKSVIKFKNNPKLLKPVFGGETRQASVFLGLKALEIYNINKILIHDAVRPFILTEDIDRVIDKIDNNIIVMTAKKVTNTIRQINNEELKTIDREYLYSVETPQGFLFNDVLEAHKNSIRKNFTDDIGIFENSTHNVQVIESRSKNDKITFIEDIYFIKYRNSVGLGFDAHRLIDTGNKEYIKLGGIDVEFDKKIMAHSDGDVILHALVDSILGAVGAGDIGVHFPPNDNKWKNADSSVFVKYALNMIKSKSGHINNVDIILICERPKINMYRLRIRERISQLLEIDVSKVNIKATTTEKMGFTGRQEGIAAQAIISIEIPL